MNALDATIVSVDGKPKEYLISGVSWWSVPVTYNCWGSKGKTELIVKDELAGLAIEVGHTFTV